MPNFFWAVGASMGVSIISLVGIITFLMKETLLKKTLMLLIAFSVGGLVGGACLHLLPEALELASPRVVFLWAIVGFIFFFLLERYFHWRHCHEGKCEIHPFTYLNLIGDGIHNFTDGLVIGASFTVGIRFGLLTTLIIILHEIPQEMGDFAVLVYGGLSRVKALYFNFLTALSCVIGTILGFFFFNSSSLLPALLPFIAGGFIYIAACDLIPELHKQRQFQKNILAALCVISGIFFIFLATRIHEH